MLGIDPIVFYNTKKLSSIPCSQMRYYGQSFYGIPFWQLLHILQMIKINYTFAYNIYKL
jgi:hypothetical protein